MMSKAQPSYSKIDYRLRPAKSIERKMIVEMLRRLDRATTLESYRYIGFGSLYFTDFELIHRALNIQDMISIEREASDKARFDFNLPFSSIELKFGDSVDILPDLEWTQQSIVWLDYDDRLDERKLADIEFLCNNLNGPSVVLVSVNCHPGQQIAGRVDMLKTELGDYMPRDWTDERVGQWGQADLYRKVINDKINESVRVRNTGTSRNLQISYSQLFNFHYRDGARMLTVGGLLYPNNQGGQIRSCSFEDFEFFKGDHNSFEIAPPMLTLREMRHIDTKLPMVAAEDEAENLGLKVEDIEKYASLYRYFPKFVDVDS